MPCATNAALLEISRSHSAKQLRIRQIWYVVGTGPSWSGTGDNCLVLREFYPHGEVNGPTPLFKRTHVSMEKARLAQATLRLTSPCNVYTCTYITNTGNLHMPISSAILTYCLQLVFVLSRGLQARTWGRPTTAALKVKPFLGAARAARLRVCWLALLQDFKLYHVEPSHITLSSAFPCRPLGRCSDQRSA